MVDNSEEADTGRQPKCLFNGGPNDNVEDLIETFQHVLGSRKLGHVVLSQDSPFLESKPAAPAVVRKPKVPAGLAAFADRLTTGKSLAALSTPSKATRDDSIPGSVKGSKSHEKRVRKKKRDADAALKEDSPTAVSPTTAAAVAAQAADESRMVAYSTKLSEWEAYCLETKEHDLLCVDLAKRQKKWKADCREAVSLLFLRVGPLVKPVLRGIVDDLDECFRALRSQFNHLGQVVTLRKIIDFVKLDFKAGSTAEEWNMMFNEAVRKFSLPATQGGVGDTITVKTLANAVFVMSLMSQPSVASFVTQSVTEGLEASIQVTQQRFVNSRALMPGPIGAPAARNGALKPTVSDCQAKDFQSSLGALRKVPEGKEVAFESKEEDASDQDQDRCHNCNRKGHVKAKCFMEGGGRWKESNKYKKIQAQKQSELKHESKSSDSKKHFRSAVRKEVARQVQERSQPLNPFATDSSDDSDDHRGRSRFRQERRPKRKRVKKRYSSGSDTDEFNFMAHECEDQEFAMPATTKTAVKAPKFIDFHVDSACTSHMVPASDHSLVSVQGQSTTNLSVATAGSGSSLETTTRALIPGAMTTTRGTRLDVSLKETLGVKSLSAPLFSVMKAVDQGHTIKFQPKNQGDSYLQLKGRKERVPIKVSGKSFIIRLHTEHGRRKQSRRNRQRTNRLLHRRCCHWNQKALSIMKMKGLASDFEWDPKLKKCKCRVCELSKTVKAPFPKEARSRAVACGVGTHWDIKGPISTESRQGSTLVAIATDDCSRHRKVFYLSSTANLHKIVAKYISGCARRGFKCSWMRWDNQFDTAAMQRLADEKSFEIQDSAAYCQSQDGVSEAAVNTWQRGVRSILKDQRRPPTMWEDASNMFVRVWNMMYTRASPTATPTEQWYGVQPSMAHLRVPLTGCTFHKYKDERKKDGTFEDRATAGILVGYAPDQRSYVIEANGTEYQRRYGDVTCDERSKLTKKEKLRRRKHVVDSDSSDDGYESSTSEDTTDSDQDSGAEVQPSPAVKQSQESPQISSDDSKSKIISSAKDVDHSEPTSQVSATTNNGTNLSEAEDEIPTRVIHVTKKQAKWGAARIAKAAGVSFADLKEWNSNLLFKPVTQFLVGTEFTVPIRTVDKNTVLEACEIVSENISSPSVQATSSKQTVTGFEHAYFISEGSGCKIREAASCSNPWSETSFFTSEGEYCFNMQLSAIVRPRNYRAAHAKSNAHSALWTAAEEKEINALRSKFKEVKIDEVLRNGQHIGRGMWQYAVKPDKLKARWCYDGSDQDSGGLGNIAAEVLRYVTCRMIIVNAVHHGHAIDVLDVSNAFLHHKAPKPFHMYHPPKTGTPGTCQEWYYMLYGRREAPMGWQEEATAFVESHFNLDFI